MTNPTSDYTHARLRQMVEHLSSEITTAFKSVMSPLMASPMPTQAYSQSFDITDPTGAVRAFTFTAGLVELTGTPATTAETGAATLGYRG